MTALYVVAGILAALALIAFVGLFIPTRPDPEPPEWVNDAAPTRPHYGRARRCGWHERCDR